jgi:hypothetical protein
MKLRPVWQQKFGYAVEAPNYKHQITNKFQWSKFQTEERRFGHLRLKFGIYLGFAIWYLEFQPCLVPRQAGG